MKKLLAVNLKIGSQIYKLVSIVHSIDKNGDNFYVFYSNTDWIKNHGGQSAIPIKYSRHATGYNNRFTFGPSKNRLGQFKADENVPIDQLDHAEGLIYLSLNNVDMSLVKLLDKVEKKREYLHTLIIDSKNYTNLTVQLFLSKKDYHLSSAKFSHKTIKAFPYREFKIVVTTRDLWIDPEKYNKDQIGKLLLS